MVNTEIMEKFIGLRAKGHSFREIAKELKKSLPTLVEWDKKVHDRITERQAKNIEALEEQYQLTLHARIESFAKSYSRLKTELTKRDTSDLSLEQLYRLVLSYDGRIGELLQVVETEKAEKPKTGLEMLLEALKPEPQDEGPEPSPGKDPPGTPPAQDTALEGAIKKAIDMGVAANRGGAVKGIAEFYIKYAEAVPAGPEQNLRKTLTEHR